MRTKFAFRLALVLSGGLFGCSSVHKHQAAMANRAGAETYISEIHMIDNRNGWAWSGGIDGSNLLLHTSDGGRTWRDRTPRAFPYDERRGDCFLDSETAWVSTLDRQAPGGGGLLHTTDGGKSWSVLIKQGAAHYGYIPEAAQCRFFNADDGVANTEDYAAGSAYVCYYETHNGGKNWKPVVIIPPSGVPDSNAPPGTIHLSDIAPEVMGYCPPANVIITHGDMDDEEPKDGVRFSVSTNLGKTWREVKLPLLSEKYREGLAACSTPVFLDRKNGWLPVRIIKYGTGDTFAWEVMAFAATHDGGETWTFTPGIIEGGSNHVEDFDIVSARDIFVRVGANLLVTHDGAKSWKTIKPNIDFDGKSSRGGVSQINFVDARHGWAVIYDTFDHYPDEKYCLYRTSDGGTTWMELPFKFSH